MPWRSPCEAGVQMVRDAYPARFHLLVESGRLAQGCSACRVSGVGVVTGIFVANWRSRLTRTHEIGHFVPRRGDMARFRIAGVYCQMRHKRLSASAESMLTRRVCTSSQRAAEY